MLLNCDFGEDSWESLGQQGDPTSPSWRRSVLSVHWKVWCWSWNSNTLATWCEELTHWKRPWFWESLKVGGKGDDRGWHGSMTSPTRWTSVWVNLGVGDGQGTWRAAVHGVAKSGLNWTEKWLVAEGWDVPVIKELGRVSLHGCVFCIEGLTDCV